MKKNEYVAPEMEIVEFTEQCSILNASDPTGGGDKGGTFPKPNGSRSMDDYEE